ncbi:hypothetical protein Tco_0446823 [Tanacetum coccineum]
MTRTVKVIENAFDAATRIILLENVENHRKTRTKELLSEALGVIGGEEDDEKVKNETCLVAQASSEIITKNKRLKATRNSLEKELSVQKEKVSTLEKNKGVDLECVKCHMLKIENEKLKEEALKLTKYEKSTRCLNEMLSNQKPSSDKLGLGFNSFEASSKKQGWKTKEIKFVKAQKKASSDGGPINMGGPPSMQATPKAIMGPPPATTLGYEKKAKDKGKAKMIEPEKPLKRKDQIMIDEEIALNHQAQLQAELEEEERLSRQKEEEANIALIESWINTQAMMDADYELAARSQSQEQEELTIEEKSKLYVELMDKRKKHFTRLRVEEQRRKPPTKAQNRNTMSTYLKNMAEYKHNQLKTKSFEDIQMLFDKTMTRVNTFVDMDTELVKGAKVDNDEEEAEMKKHMEIVPDDEVATDAIPLATKPPIINIDREDLETLWKLVEAKRGLTRPEESYERVLWGDLKVMFELDVESEVWSNLQGHKVTVWKLFLQVD